MQQERECICRFCKKLLNSPEGKRVPVVSIFNTLKNKELIVASGQESVVLAAKVEKLGHCLQRKMRLTRLHGLLRFVTFLHLPFCFDFWSLDLSLLPTCF